MKRYVLMSLLLVSMFACPAVLSQEFNPERREMHERDMEMRELQEREMKLQHREAEMNAEREMQKHELEQRRMEMERTHHDDDGDHCKCEGALVLLLVICVIVRILLAVWVYKDIQQLKHGSGIWIIIVLLSGLLGALVYAVVRLGDNKQK